MASISDSDGDLGFHRVAHIADTMVHLDLSMAPDRVSRPLRILKARANPGGAGMFGMRIDSREGIVLGSVSPSAPAAESVGS